MEITMYELLGMMKDGKAPKKIRYNNVILYYDNENGDYYKYYGNYLFSCLFHREYTTDFLNYPVEILEEEKKLPEKIEYYDDSVAWVIDNVGQLSDVDKVIIDKLNEVLDYFKSKGE